MPKDPSPLLGYNNNIKHKNRVFHVQTEDSGVKHPHIITHLFMDGGRILKSVKKSYAEYLGVDKMADVVRQMMKEQHKGMLIALRDGQFDQILQEADSPKPAVSRAPQPPVSPVSPADAPRPPASPSRPALPPPAMPAAVARKASVRPPPVKPSSRPPPPVKPSSRPPPQLSSRPPVTSPKAPVTLADAPKPPAGPPPPWAEEAPPTARTGSSADLQAALEEAAGTSSPAFEPLNDLPPPPANLFRPKEPGSIGGYRALTPAPEVPMSSRPPPPSSRRPPPSSRFPRAGTPIPPSSRAPLPPSNRAPHPPSNRPDPRVEKSPPARSPTARTPPVPPAAAPRPPSEARYAPARPAAIFGQAGPKRGASIFGEDLISDKSLDEVILGYLAEDLEAPHADPKKKKK